MPRRTSQFFHLPSLSIGMDTSFRLGGLLPGAKEGRQHLAGEGPPIVGKMRKGFGKLLEDPSHLVAHALVERTLIEAGEWFGGEGGRIGPGGQGEMHLRGALPQEPCEFERHSVQSPHGTRGHGFRIRGRFQEMQAGPCRGIAQGVADRGKSLLSRPEAAPDVEGGGAEGTHPA